MKGLHIDIVVIAVYFAVLLLIGYLTSRKIKGSEDYTIAGRKLGYPALLGALIGTAIGAAATVGKAGKAYEVGIALFFATFAYGIGLILFGFIAPIIRKIEIWTIPDALVLRYGSAMRVIVAVVMILGVIALFGAQLIATGLAVQAVFGDMGISYTQGILWAGIIMTVYIIMGGLMAVAYTDLFQTIIMIIGVAILLPIFVVKNVGGAATAWEWIQTAARELLGRPHHPVHHLHFPHRHPLLPHRPVAVAEGVGGARRQAHKEQHVRHRRRLFLLELYRGVPGDHGGAPVPGAQGHAGRA